MEKRSKQGLSKGQDSQKEGLKEGQKHNFDQAERRGIIDWFIRLLKGFIIGFGGIVPGLSGGVLSVILGVYDRAMRFLANIRRNFVKNVLYFIPIGLGGVMGILFFAGVIEAAFGTYAALFTALFIGFVAGTLPSIFKKAGARGRMAPDYMIMTLSSIFVFCIMLLGEQSFTQIEPSIPVWLASGVIVALGFIVPGLSPSNFLIYFGLYDKMAAGLKAVQLSVVIPLLLGAVICVILFAKLVNRLFDRHYSKMYHLILGLVLGSTFAIFPTVIFPAFSPGHLAAMGLSLVSALVISLLLFGLGIVISYLFSKLEDKYEPADD